MRQDKLWRRCERKIDDIIIVNEDFGNGIDRTYWLENSRAS